MNTPTLAVIFPRRLAMIIAAAVSTLVFAQPARAAQPQAARIDRISPSAARLAERVTITGIGFGASNVRITVGGISARVVSATGNQVTFLVPPGLAPGFARVTATNPGGQTGSTGFNFLEGILLLGGANTLAINSMFDLPPVGVDQSQIEAGVIMTRLDVYARHDATVGDVNAALVSVNGGIVSMLADSTGLTVAVPRQGSFNDIQALAQTLMGMSGILFAAPGRVKKPNVLFPSTIISAARHLVPPRFPAAWNASALLLGCASKRVPVLIPDHYSPTPPSGFDSVFPGFAGRDLSEGIPTSEDHGYNVMAVLATPGQRSPTAGANPFIDCLDLRPLQIANLGNNATQDKLVLNFPPSGKFIVNWSLGDQDDCEDNAGDQIDCTPAEVASDIKTPLERAHSARRWKEISNTRWDNFLVAAAAGNARNDGLAGVTIYPGLGRAANEGEMTVASQPDPFFGFAQDASQWAPNAFFVDQGFPSLAASDADMADLRGEIILTGLNTAVADNVVTVGATTTIPDVSPFFVQFAIDALSEADFSNSDPDVKAVGEQVSGVCFGIPCPRKNGTSFAAPQVAGLASYLWLLSPELRAKPASITKQAIVLNARNGAHTTSIVDAYATVLSLDPAALPTPATARVRLAILDVNDDGKFDENDITLFLAHYLDANGNEVNPPTPDFSRFDLNGNGFTGGSNRERFDLDREGSKQFGATLYTQVLQNIGGDVSFDENNLKDLEILCYYAYSKMYTGDETARDHLLANRCTPITVDVTPAAVTLQPGGTQQFGATVHGTPNPQVTWGVDGVNGGNSIVGTISSSGLYTAPSSVGTHTVRATSVADPDAFGEATVTIGAGISNLGIFTPGRDLFGRILPGTVGALVGSTVLTAPISDVDDLLSKVKAALAGATKIGNVSIFLDEAVSLNLNLGSTTLGDLGIVGNACGSSVTVTAGDVLPGTVTSTSRGIAAARGCLSVLTLKLGDIKFVQLAQTAPGMVANLTVGNITQGLFLGSLFFAGPQSSTVNVSAGTINTVEIFNTSNLTAAVQGSVAGNISGGVFMGSNTNLTLTAPITGGDIQGFEIETTSFAAPPSFSVGNILRNAALGIPGDVTISSNTGLSLSLIQIGNIGGNLIIVGNRGFSNDDAGAFANARTVGGFVSISGNSP